jgi:hypothetical protein
VCIQTERQQGLPHQFGDVFVELEFQFQAGIGTTLSRASSAA